MPRLATKMTARAALILMPLIVTGCSDRLYSDQECHDIYEHEYVFKDDPAGLSEADYCEKINDTSIVGRDGYPSSAP